MSEFSILLGNIIKKNNISIYSLSKDIECGRTWLQKVLSGERRMDMKNFMALYRRLINYADSVSLSYLYESFALDYYGSKEYQIITYIKKRLMETKELSDYLEKIQYKEFSLKDYFIDNSGIEIDSNEKEIAENVYRIVTEEIKQAKSDNAALELYINFPSNWKYIKNLILVLLNINEIRYSNNFKYIVNSENRINTDIEQLENFLTASEFASYGYNTYISDTNMGQKFINNAIFPYYIITKNKIALITDDGKTLIENTNKEVIRKTSMRFEKIISEKKSFLTTVNVDMYNSVVMDRDVSDNNEFFEISNRISITKFYSKDILRKIIAKDYPDREFMIGTLDMFYEKIRNSVSSMYFTIDSVRHFMETDETKNEGGYFNLNFTNDLKIEMLKSVYEYYKNGEGEIHMLKTGSYLASDNIYIFGWQEKIICMANYLYYEDKPVDAMAVIQSPVISKHMSNYNKYMMNSKLCLDKENSLKVLKNLINAYEESYRNSA